VGSNIEREKHTKAGLDALFQAFGELLLSSVYESESVGFAGDNFYNLVVKASTPMSILEVCQVLKKIEQDNHRQRAEKKFAPRTLDLDLLLYAQQQMTAPVELPRPEILYNAFVLRPLAEIAGASLHPVTQESFQQLWQNYDTSQQNLWTVEFTWSPNVL
jgi:2-amino-4-hydroxy-6-hydroxymethyldihydropteridine diphosphokinase